MATYIKTLKEDNGDITYPQTKAEAVLLSGGTDLETELSQPVTTSKIADAAITADKIDWTSLQKHYKSCNQVNPFNISTAWTRVVPSGWSLTFSTTVGEVYKVEIVTGYLCWNGSANTELDMHLGFTGATQEVYPASCTMTGTYGGGVSIGRRVSGILKATGSSMTVRAEVAAGATGNYARIDQGYILAERIA